MSGADAANVPMTHHIKKASEHGQMLPQLPPKLNSRQPSVGDSPFLHSMHSWDWWEGQITPQSRAQKLVRVSP